MSIVFDKEWYELPRPHAGAKLVEIRNELRAKNLHDTEEPPLERREEPVEPRGSRHANKRWDIQRFGVSADGERRHAVRPERAAQRDVSRHRESPDAKPANRQPRAADADPLPAGVNPERAGGSLDSVPGPRLVHAQEGRLDEHARYPTCGR